MPKILIGNFKGPKGDKGDKGDIGATGAQGIKGAAGATGLQGIQGVKGDTGATGVQGPIGAKGAQGQIGLTGPTGPKGDTGAQGSIGATGPQGLPGKDGNAKIASNLTTTDATYALAAPQGRILKLNAIQIGDILLSTVARTGWLECAGQAVSRTTYAALFTAIGTKYGTGNGTTTFNLPNVMPPLDYAITGTAVQLKTAVAVKYYIKALEVA